MRKIYTLLLLGLFSVQVFSQIPEYCLENEKVHSYLNRGTYPDNDYSFTWIMDYCYSYPWNWKVEGKGVRLDLPKPVPVELDSPLPVVSTLYVSEYEDFGDAYSMTIPAGQVKADVYNLIPGKTYNYKVEYDNGGVMTVAKQGQFKTTGHLRMLKIDGIFNVRDMGGWIGLGGNPIKYGKLIRGSRMNVNGSSTLLITPEGIEELRRIGVKADLDLRDAGDAVNATHSFLGEDIPIKNINGAYGSRIATFADKPQSIQGIKQIISWFKEDRPVYFHCSVGADRTGTVAYLIGALCGMSEDALCKEFELTSFSADSITNSRDTPNPERLIRQRTDVGRLDPNDDNDSYKFANMVAKIKSFPGATLQRKVYNHLREGVQGYSISAEDLAFLIKYLTDYSILAGIKCDVDTLNMEVGQTHQLDVKADPVDADHSDPTFKSTSNLIATVDKDGKVTAVGGGQAYIIVNLDGIEKYIPVYVPMTEDDIPSYSVYNKAVGPYLTETQYSADDYTVSTVSKYDTIDMGYGRRDWPAAFRIQWMVCDGVKNQHLTISENPDFSYSVVDVDLADTDSTYRVEDLNPQTVYYYKISGTLYGNSMMLSSSAFKVDGAVKIIKMQEIYNVRDLGGWTGMNGHNVKYGVLFRGSRLREDLANGGKTLTDAVKAIKSAYKLNAEIDLRTADEVSAGQSVFGNKVQAKFLKVTNAKDCLGENILSGDAYIKALQSIIDWVKLGKHIYIGSSLGAERAGTMAFLINGLLGVDEDALSKDYELSSFTEDEQAAGREFKRNEGIYPAMVSKIKTLEGGTLQVKIYNYFKNGIGGTSISEDDLKTFICYMLDCTDQELEDALSSNVKQIVINKAVGDKLFNAIGQEIPVPGNGFYISEDGTKYIIIQ